MTRRILFTWKDQSSRSPSLNKNSPAAAAAAAADDAAEAAFCARRAEQGPFGFWASRAAERAALSAAKAALDAAALAADWPPSPGKAGRDWAETTAPLPATSVAAKRSAHTTLEVLLLWEEWRTMVWKGLGSLDREREGKKFLSCVLVEARSFFYFFFPFNSTKTLHLFLSTFSLSLIASSSQSFRALLRPGSEAGSPK